MRRDVRETTHGTVGEAIFIEIPPRVAWVVLTDGHSLVSLPFTLTAVQRGPLYARSSRFVLNWCGSGQPLAMDDRYRTGQKGLNTTGGSNRFKFQGKQARARQVDVDVAHKVRAEGFLDADKAQDPEVEGGSFFQQELDRSKELNVTPPFKRFYYKVCRSPCRALHVSCMGDGCCMLCLLFE